MEKTADLIVVQMTLDTLHQQGKPQEVIAKMAGCSLSSVSKHCNGKLIGREECARKRCTSSKNEDISVLGWLAQLV